MNKVEKFIQENMSNVEDLLGKALDFIVETQENNDYICEQMVEERVGNYCEENCQNLNRQCVLRFLEKVYKAL